MSWASQIERNKLHKKLDKIWKRWDEAPTPRRRVNACKAALAFLEEAYLRHQWNAARPDGLEREKWEDRLAVAEGRPRKLPRAAGAWVVYEAHKAPNMAEVAVCWSV